jgi:hypothetical protein
VRARSRKESGSWVDAAPALSGKSKRSDNTSLLLPSLWFAVWHGLMTFFALRLDAPVLHASLTRLSRVRQRYLLRSFEIVFNLIWSGAPNGA